MFLTLRSAPAVVPLRQNSQLKVTFSKTANATPAQQPQHKHMCEHDAAALHIVTVALHQSQ
jgi:hypothetical protein